MAAMPDRININIRTKCERAWITESGSVVGRILSVAKTLWTKTNSNILWQRKKKMFHSNLWFKWQRQKEKKIQANSLDLVFHFSVPLQN